MVSGGGVVEDVGVGVSLGYGRWGLLLRRRGFREGGMEYNVLFF